jgi:hypothetical protein
LFSILNLYPFSETVLHLFLVIFAKQTTSGQAYMALRGINLYILTQACLSGEAGVGVLNPPVGIKIRNAV